MKKELFFVFLVLAFILSLSSVKSFSVDECPVDNVQCVLLDYPPNNNFQITEGICFDGSCCIEESGSGIKIDLPQECSTLIDDGTGLPGYTSYLKAFEAQDVETVSIDLSIYGKTEPILPSCHLDFIIDRGILNGNENSIIYGSCAGSSCTESFKLYRPIEPENERSETVRISVSASAACCLDKETEVTSLNVNLQSPLFAFGGVNGFPLIELGKRLPNNVYVAGNYDPQERDAYSGIAEIAKTSVLIPESNDPRCIKYPEISLLGFSNGGHAALYNAKRLGEEYNVKVNKIFLIDPVPWPGLCALEENCNYIKPANVEEATSVYQTEDTSSFPWSQRGRYLINSASTQIVTWVPISTPIEELDSGCHADTIWPINAHNKILCDKNMIDTAIGFLKDLRFRENYEWTGTNAGHIMTCFQLPILPIGPLCFQRNNPQAIAQAFQNGEIELEETIRGLSSPNPNEA